MNELDNALKDYNKAISINDKKGDIYNNRGNLFYRMKKYNMAIKDFNIETVTSTFAMIEEMAPYAKKMKGRFNTSLNVIGDSLMEKYFISNPYIETSDAVWATIILIFFGALAGYLPARKAAKIKPIIALRDK